MKVKCCNDDDGDGEDDNIDNITAEKNKKIPIRRAQHV